MATILLTGSAGFIGFHTTKRLLDAGDYVIGIDNFNNYYDPSLKEKRNKILEKYSNYKLYRGDISDLELIKKIFSENSINKVCHLAAQAGVRFSLQEPYRYTQSNITGFLCVLNEAKNFGVKDFVFASSSSIYGNQKTAPFLEEKKTDEPLSLYAATKKANELMAYTYHHLYGMNCTGLRFFTVYGPESRPDMAMYSFAKAIINKHPIQVFNNGEMKRDFTYVDDIVDGILKALEYSYPFEIFNLGSSQPIKLSYMIDVLEREIGQNAIKEFLPIQPGDVSETFADISKAKEKLGWSPNTSFENGVKDFISWFRNNESN